MTVQCCYHCGLEVPPDNDFALIIDGVRRAMCCPGCAAVASTIMQNGLQRFYQFRSAPSAKMSSDSIVNGAENPFADWDLDEIQQSYISVNSEGIKTLRLVVDNISCAACTWLIEKHLGNLQGVVRVAINGTTHRGEVSWQPQSIHLSQILMALRQIGYDPRPINSSSDLSPSVTERRNLLLRLGVAGLAMMQTGMAAIALYAGSFQGMDSEWQTVLRLVSALFVTPVVFYSAQPFFRSAWRSVKTGQLVMDVPVALAVGLAFCASIWVTFSAAFSDSVLTAGGGGEVYFDSISMLIFFLLLGRFAEQSIREKNLRLLDRGTLLPPVAAQVFPEQSPAVAEKRVPIATLAADDFIRVDAGQVIPCDGIIEQGRSQISEVVLTGELRPVNKQAGDRVCAGTVNGGNPLLIKVTAVGEATSLAAILQLAERAAAEKPPWAMLADRLAGVFVATLLVIAVLVASYWWLHEPARLLWVTLSVLVVTCPCALSLATPTALTVATTLLRRQGFLIHRGHVLEAMPAIDRVIFDKTGTLTEGDLKLIAIQRSEAAPPSGQISDQQLIGWAAALEQGSQHPIARGFQQQLHRGFIVPAVEQQTFVAGCGVSAVIDRQQFFLGNMAWVCEQTGIAQHRVCPDARAQQHNHCVEVALACTGSIKKNPSDEQKETGEVRKPWLVVFYFADQLRSTALAAVEQLRQRGLKVSLLSGDRSPAAADIIAPLTLSNCQFGLHPQQKLDVVRNLQAAKNKIPGEKILMVGDGINDVPVLQAADVSVAMGRASDLSRIHADATLLGTDLTMLPRAIDIAVKTRRVIQQNIGWAVGYNLVALPLAAAGYVAPWAAAIGMSASSLLVLLNALRLNRQGSGDTQLFLERRL